MRQYILTENKTTPEYAINWNKFEFSNLTLYSGFPTYQFKSDNYNIILTGIAFHVAQTEYSEQEIVENAPKDYHQFLDYLDLLSGCFVIFVEINNTLTIYNDLSGSLKIFYSIVDESVKSVASDPKLLEISCTALVDKSTEAIEFYTSDFFTKYLTRVGDLTSFSNVFQVLPNHELGLSENKTKRFFPRSKKEILEVDEAINMFQKRMNGTIESAQRKYNLKCSITAGWDSRVVMASTKKHKDSTVYYTINTYLHKDSDPDFWVPRAITNKLDLKYTVLNCESEIEETTLKLIKNHFQVFRLSTFANIINAFSQFDEDNDLLLIGSVSEICKNYYENVAIIDGRSFAQASHFPTIPYVVSYFEKKYTELNEVCEKSGYDLRDLAHWEQDIANFAGQNTSYVMSFSNVVSPFNNRELIKSVLSVPRKMRDTQFHEFYKMYIDKQWKELNDFPFNPTVKQKLIRLSKKLGIYSAYKKLATQIRK